MGKSLTRKIIESHYVSGSMVPGEEVFIKVDQTLTHDINAVMTYLAFEAIGLDRIRTECSVSYLDHNLLYVDHKTPDDHIYLQSAAKKFGVHVSRPGNGICHTVHVARFGVPGKDQHGRRQPYPSRRFHRNALHRCWRNGCCHSNDRCSYEAENATCGTGLSYR